MYPYLHSIFADREDGSLFACFDLWHFFYILLIIFLIAGSVYFLRNKSKEIKEHILMVWVSVAFILYMADFFLMPFAYCEIDVDKLPFHSCTAMCIMCFLSNHNNFLKKYRVNFAMLGCISNLMYICYPAGIMGYNPISYRAIQTLLFHSIMIVYGAVTIFVEYEKLNIKRCYRDLAILGLLTLWAILGNTLYSGAAGSYSHDFNWFFIKADPFGGIVPENIAPYVLPIINIGAFFGIEIIIYLSVALIKKHLEHKNGITKKAV